MNVSEELADPRPCWFVGAYYLGGGGDQTAKFLEAGIWENGYPDRYHDEVNSIRPGDRIAIKAAYTRKHGLPFDNHGHTVSVMAIKATGTVKRNHGDGQHLDVEWAPLVPPREWYLFTNLLTVWKVQPGREWRVDALIDFAFGGIEQDIHRFRNYHIWRNRFGDQPTDDTRFKWTRFYEGIADGLLAFRENREPLIQGIHAIAERGHAMPNSKVTFADDSGPLKDICPFTTMGMFNRRIKPANKKSIAKELADLLDVDVPVPDSFEGVPELNNQSSWFFDRKDRGTDDIDVLWEVFASAIEFAETGENEDARISFAQAYDKALQIRLVKWKLSMGLYWARPWSFQNLDSRSRSYLSEEIGIPVADLHTARDYIALLDTLEEKFQLKECPVHSFPELSLAAWQHTTEVQGTDQSPPSPVDDPEPQPDLDNVSVSVEPYSVDNILKAGCFLPRDKIEEIIERLRSKKNLILQGPPGTGKTWLAKRLAFALINQRDEYKVRSMQFHPNLSYEDFVRGLRPARESNGRLELVDGPFIEMINAAKSDQNATYVLVIEEINRGQPAQIFGEMLTLLEADKRNSDSALELTYRRSDGEKVYVPENLFVIGTMNIADRSLALVDFAFRRRFAFVDLEPVLNERWSGWVHDQCGIDSESLSQIAQRLSSLNDTISEDPNLGPQFRIGHSFVTPGAGSEIPDAGRWFRQVVRTEIGPLLEEYWFDNRKQAESQQKQLLEGI